MRALTDRFGVMEALSRLLGVSLIYPAGRLGFLPVPQRTPVTVCIGRPLRARRAGAAAEPSEAEVDALHAELVQELSDIYHRWRGPAGYGDVELVVV